MHASSPRTYLWAAYIAAFWASPGDGAMADTPTMTAKRISVELERRDPVASRKVQTLRSRVTGILNAVALAEVCGPDSRNRVTQIANWPGAPFQVVAATADRVLRIRLENDFVVIWNRRQTPLMMDRAPRDIIRQATQEILDAPCSVGSDDTIAGAGGRNGLARITLLEDAKLVEGTGAVTCSYLGQHRSSMRTVDKIHVLAKDRNVIVVLRTLKVRKPGSKYHYEGLAAAKIRLTKEEFERAARQPVLARNVVFDGKTDLSKLTSAVLNGCMWPLAGDDAVEIRDVCSALALGGFHRPIQYLAWGPADSASFEMALFDRMGAYAYGIWPRAEKLANAERPGRQYVAHIEQWLERILQEDIKPAAGRWGTDRWLMVPQLRLDEDFILGRFVSWNQKIQGDVEFQATVDDLSITVKSSELFSIDRLDDAKVRQALCAILHIPPENIKDLRVESHSGVLGDDKTPVCYGKVFCNWNLHKDPLKFDREWWSYIPFWITTGKMCVFVSTRDWQEFKRHPPAINRSGRMRSQP